MRGERGRTYTKADVNRLLEQHVARIRELAAENKSLGAQVTGLLRQLADADDALLQIDADTRRLSRGVREYVEETERQGASHPSVQSPVASSTGDGPRVHPPAHLRLVSQTVSTEGEQ